MNLKCITTLGKGRDGDVRKYISKQLNYSDFSLNLVPAKIRNW